MGSPGNALREVGSSHPEGLTYIPAGCYDACNNAYLEAQAVGETPALCDRDSTFISYYNGCSNCLSTYMSKEDTETFLRPNFGQWIDYCGLGTALPSQTTLVSFTPKPDTTVITIETSLDGHRTLWLFTTTFAHLPESFSAAKPSSSTIPQITPVSTSHISVDTPSSPTSPAESGDARQRSLAWVAGPVIGGVAGVVVLLLLGWLLLRAKRERDTQRRRCEVHGESVLKAELEAKLQPQELDSRERDRSPVELPGLNP
ncbi:hypothetical protein F4802DRAFT_549260 [Xylaria palmicola]|nr:hypothetical protein F4802DRAFT_549260 [Xylaria palmicola]